MADAKKVYWDSSILISFLSDTHPLEKARADIAEDILKYARSGEVEIWTSVWTIVEVIRPKDPVPEVFTLPAWAELLNATGKDGALLHPKATGHLKQIWEYHERHTRPERLIPEADAQKIRAMFDWPWLKTVDVLPPIAHRATEISRAFNMKGGDSIHVASALYRKCEVLHRWDKDFTKTDGLIQSVDPERMSPQNVLPGIT